MHAARSVRLRGEVPLLHVLMVKPGAIRLYKELAFEFRRDLHIAVLEK